MILVSSLWTFCRAVLFGSAAIALENLALRHQLLVLQRSVVRPRLPRWDRVFWVWFSRVWASWRSSLVIVQPATVLTWHRQGFRLYWRWKSRPNPVGRPKLDAEIRRLIRRMARENPTWGRRRIQAELALLDGEVDLGSRTAGGTDLTLEPHGAPSSPRMPGHRRHRLLRGPHPHLPLLFVFVVLRHDRRELLHFNVTHHLTADWTARQILQTFPEETAPRYMPAIGIPSTASPSPGASPSWGFERCALPKGPRQNAFVERVVGSIRRECLDHVIILSGAHLCRVLRAYLAYYNTARPHQSLDNNSPHPRVVERQPCSRIIAIPQVGGLHHRYRRVA